jgi:hypothetical protein
MSGHAVLTADLGWALGARREEVAGRKAAYLAGTPT